MNQNTNTLRHLQKCLQIQYEYYKRGEITERQYLTRIKPIDLAIDKMELASLNYVTLPDNFALPGSS